MMNEASAGCYAAIPADLRRKYRLIDTNDSWIAAAAVEAGFPLVTNHNGHFFRFAGLQLVDY